MYFTSLKVCHLCCVRIKDLTYASSVSFKNFFLPDILELMSKPLDFIKVQILKIAKWNLTQKSLSIQNNLNQVGIKELLYPQSKFPTITISTYTKPEHISKPNFKSQSIAIMKYYWNIMSVCNKLSLIH